MENVKKYKLLYILVGVIVVLICIIICFIMDNNDDNEEYNYMQIVEENIAEDNSNVSEKLEDDEIIYIHISGEVMNPGVFELHEGDRIKDAIEKAGGLTENANTEKVNLAYQLSDGQKINIPNVNDESDNEENYIIENDGENIVVSDENSKENSKININTATQSELETLTGIGPSTAAKIIEYRNTNGKFKNIEEIKNVSGIGEAKYKNIENDIVVK